MANKKGRPSKKTPERVQKIHELAREGLTEDQIAEIVGVTRTTLQNWKGQDLDFLVALNKNKMLADQLVEASLFQRALGYNAVVTKPFFDKENGEVVIGEGTKHVPPDSTAMIFWLKNRQPKKWRDRQEVQVEAKSLIGVVTQSGDEDDITR